MSWQSPSNLALVKYWGKFGRQYPKNPSLSFTLSNAHTIMDVEYEITSSLSDKQIELDFRFEGKEKVDFANKIKAFLSSIDDRFPFIYNLKLKIESSNSFPHSSGIASSASAMSTLALVLVSIEREIYGNLKNESEFLQKASDIARLGSGSASRSVYPYLALWGQMEGIENSSNEFAIPYYEEFDTRFLNFHDDILIVSKSEKSVSSTAGHKLMENNIYATKRYEQANQRLADLILAMKKGDLTHFGKIVEDEALTLHALMMCSDPSYILIEPQTLSLIKEIRAYRASSKVPVYFSLDAGPNIHLLYPDEDKEAVDDFIKNNLNQYCKEILKDQVGKGPIKLN